MAKCDFDPTKYRGTPIGMFHCPKCGEMVIAGLPHQKYNEELPVDMRCGFCNVPIVLPDEIEDGVEYLCWNCNAIVEVSKRGGV